MNKSTRTTAVAATVCMAILAASGCSLVESDGIDYSSAGTGSAPVPAGAPESIAMTVTKSWSMAQADRVQGMDTLADGSLLAIAAPDVASGEPGELISVNTATDVTTDPATMLHPIAFGSEYAAAQDASIQVAHGWAAAASPSGDTLVSAGNRYGVLADLERSPDEPGNYLGVATNRPGSPITPVTGACSFPGTGEDASGTMTTDGSNTIERRLASPVGPGDGRPARVTMQAGAQLGVRDSQQGIADQTGPAAPPNLAPAQDLLVGGLSDMVCLTDGQVDQLHQAGVTNGVRTGRGASVLAVIDRELADGWYAGGVDLVEKTTQAEHAAGTHSSGALVGRATASGTNRIDAVAVDTGTGVAVAGFQLRGNEVADDAQITSLTLDKADGSKGWATIAGSDRLYEFVIGVT